MQHKNVSVYFLGEKYTFPKDVITYKNDQEYFKELMEDLLSFSLDTCSNIDDLSSNVSKLMFLEFLDIGYSCVNKLNDNDIYGISVDSLIGIRPEIFSPEICYAAATNDGVRQFYKELMDLEIEKSEALKEQEKSFEIQSYDAEIERDSKVTGTGIGVVTNDTTQFAAWAAMEDQTKEEQFSEADDEYHDELDSISDRLEMETHDRLHEFEQNYWIPNLKKSIELVMNILFQRYIDILIAHGKFEQEALLFTNFEMSNKILKMIDDSEYRPKILEAALLSCPINPEVYKLAMNSTNVEEIVKCAKVFKVENIIGFEYQTECRMTAQDDALSEKELKDKTSLFLKAISLIDNGLTEEDVLNIHRKIIQDKISQYANFSNDKLHLKIKEYIKSLHVFSSFTKDEISEENLEQCVKQKLLDDIFSKNGKADWIIYKDQILHTVERILQDVKNYWLQIINAKLNYLSKKKEYDELYASATNNINEIQDELNSLNVFSFRRKKDLNRKKLHLKWLFINTCG